MMRGVIVAAICAAAFAGQATAADIKVFSDGPLERALVAAAKAFGNETGHNVNFVFGLSPVIHKRISEGERGDLVIIQPAFIGELVKAGKVVAGDHPTVASVGVGLMVRADAKAPDVASVEAFKRALQAADTIVFNNVASGNAFAQVLDRVGLADSLNSKIVRAPPTEVTARILQGAGNDIGAGLLPVIIADKRFKLAGALPAELQSPIPYAVAPMTDAGQPEAAKAFVQFLVSPKTKAEFAAAGII
jgi:molybdate transport system substrate-binding protein